MAVKKKRRLRTLDDVVRLLGSVINQLEQGELEEGRARAIVYAAGVLRQAIEGSELEKRIQALEAAAMEGKL
ncbi:hypothetical protein [Megalodesulfovibrio gigas]|nr:hypothetical protein [Megalodesulfovibrio gigas]